MNALEAYQLVLPHLPATRSQLAKKCRLKYEKVVHLVILMKQHDLIRAVPSEKPVPEIFDCTLKVKDLQPQPKEPYNTKVIKPGVIRHVLCDTSHFTPQGIPSDVQNPLHQWAHYSVKNNES